MTRRPRLGLLFVLLALAACVGGLWLWQQQTRSGKYYEQRGLADARAGRIAQAQQDWEQGVKEDPSYPGCYARLGELYQNARDNTKAAGDYTAALTLDPHNGLLFLRLAQVEQEQGHLLTAAAAAAQAARLRPDDPDAQVLDGQLADKCRNTPAAMAALRRAHQLRPASRDDLARLVNLEMEHLDVTDAEHDLTPWLRDHPDDPGPCYDMAAVYNAKARTPDNLRAGIGYAQRAIAGMPGDPRPVVLLGQLYLDADRPQDAVRTLLAGVRTAPCDAGLLHGLVQAYTRLSRPRQASEAAGRLSVVTAREARIEHLETVLYFHRADTVARLESARLAEENGQQRRAEGSYILAVRNAPQDPRARAALVSFLRRTNRPELAQQAAEPNFMP